MKKSPAFILLAALILASSCSSRAEKLQSQKEKKLRAQSQTLYQTLIYGSQRKREETLSSYIRAMPLERKIAQLFIENLEGNSSFRSYETFGDMTGKPDGTPLIAGGYLFFSYNLCDTAEETHAFIDSIRQYAGRNSQIQPFLAIDQEGGWVNRLKKLTERLPSQEEVAAKFDVGAAYDLYASQAKKMAEIGFNMNLAPVIEVRTDDNAEFLDGRSFGDSQKVSSYGRACVNAYQNNGIAAVIKHFPGNTNTDPHTGLPEITLSAGDLQMLLEPFRSVSEHSPAGILMSHARTAALDKGTPACLSKDWVSGVLRRDYGYKGIIFSDDIFMGALAANGFPPEKAAVLAIEAGVDCIMTSEKRFASQARVLYRKALEDEVFAGRIDESLRRILEYKLSAGLFDLGESDEE